MGEIDGWFLDAGVSVEVRYKLLFIRPTTGAHTQIFTANYATDDRYGVRHDRPAVDLSFRLGLAVGVTYGW